MTKPADFTDFLAEVFQGQAWLFDQSQTIGRTYEDGDFTMAQDELADLKLLGDEIQAQATARGIDLTQFSLVKNSLAASGDNVLTSEILGSIAYGVHLSQNVHTYRDENGEYIKGADGDVLNGAEGAQAFGINGNEDEAAAEGIAKAIIEDNRNPQNNNNAEHKQAMSYARISVSFGI